MKRIAALLLATVTAGAFVSAAAQAQRDMRFRGSEGWGLNTRYEQLFDNSNVRSFIASVVRVDTLTPMREEKMAPAMRVIVKIESGNEEIPVHIGPMWFAISQDIGFPRGEKMEIKGYRANFQNSEFIMAVEIRSKHRIFRFRDDDGFPYWTVLRPR